MIWADKLAVIWAGVVAFLYFLMCQSSTGIDPVFLANVPYVIFWLAVPPWLILRGIWWVTKR